MLKNSKSDKLRSFDAANRSTQCVRAARHATYAMFLADGLGFGIWAGHIPAFKQKFQLSDSSLSIVLLAVAVGAILSMPLAGQAVRHFGSRLSIAVSVACFGLCLASIALAPSLILFVVAALLFGAGKGAVDVGINAQAVVVERCCGRPVMSSFQALWSVGGLAGGFLTSAALGLGSTPVTNLLCVGSLILLVDLLFYSHLLSDTSFRESEGGKPFRLPSKSLFYVAILTFIALFSEGVLQDWAAVYMLLLLDEPLADDLIDRGFHKCCIGGFAVIPVGQVPAGSMEIFLQLAYGVAATRSSIGRTSTFLPPERTTLSPGRAAQKELRLPRRANRAHRKLRFRHEVTDVRFCDV